MSAVSAPYHPGQAPWPDHQSQRPDRSPPIQFHTEDQAPRGNPALAWTLRIVGLVAVAVISGVVWWYIQNEDLGGSPTGYGGGTEQQSSGKYDFTAEVDQAREDDACADHAYGETQRFLQDHQCARLTRSVFTTTIDGRTIYASVSVVEMADEDSARALRELTDTDGSGNVNDLVREGLVKVDGLDQLSGNDGYDSAQEGTRVTIVEADYDPAADKDGTEAELDDVCTDAIRLGAEMVAGSG